jgi:predicted short-subunit dehydrogenase-like oxidoreductase (DUF2520 family)
MTTRVAVLGPGRLGTALASALPADRYTVAAVAGRGAASLEAFVDRVPTAAVRSAVQAARGVDLVLVTVPDDTLVPLVREVARDDGVRPGSRWVHCAGGHGLEPLRPAALAGARVAACHPAQTFPDPDRGPEQLAGTAWAVTAAAADAAWASALVEELGGVPHAVGEHARALYHAALAVGSNGVVAVVSLARDLLLGAGIGDPEAFLGPLVSASADGAVAGGARALTGPVRRGDAGTVATHLEELDRSYPEAAEAYRALARLALGYARRAGLEADAADRVEGVLG